MSAETITFDSLESAGQAIPVVGDVDVNAAGVNGEENAIHENQVETDVDDPNVQVPEGMKRVYIDFTVQKQKKEDDGDESETIAADEALAIAEDTKKHHTKVASPNSRKVATTWADCKAKNKSTCPYHGAAFMRDQFNAIFQKFGFTGAEARVAPYGNDESPLPAYRLYFNVKKDFDKKQLQKAFNEMMKIPGVGELKVDDLVDKKYHTEPESKELSYDIEEFDPNIDPNEEMKADLERERAEAEKKAAEEKAKAEAAKKAEEELKKSKEAERKEADEQFLKTNDSLVGASYAKYEVREEMPKDAKGRYEYLTEMMGKMPDLANVNNYLGSAKDAYDEYVKQEKSLKAIEEKIASTNNPETRKVLERLADVSCNTLTKRDEELENALTVVEGDIIDLCEDCRENYDETCGEKFIDGEKAADENEKKLGELSEENGKAFQEKNKELLDRVTKGRNELGKAFTLYTAYSQKMGDAERAGRWDKAAAILSDDNGLERVRKEYLEVAAKLKADNEQLKTVVDKALKAQEVSRSTKGSTADAADVSALAQMTDKYIRDGQQKELFAQGVQKLPAKFAKFVLQGVSYKKGKGHSWARHEQFGQSLINLGAKDQNRMGHTLTHELGHGFAYKLGFVHGKPIPPQIQDFMRIMDDEGRDAMKTVLGTYAPPKKGKFDNYAKLKLWGTTEMKFKGMPSVGSHETWDEIRDSNDILGLSDVFGCVNGGGFVGHAGGVYKSDWRRGQEMFANGVAALAGYHKSIEKLFPKSLAKLREIIENANLAYA